MMEMTMDQTWGEKLVVSKDAKMVIYWDVLMEMSMVALKDEGLDATKALH